MMKTVKSKVATAGYCKSDYTHTVISWLNRNRKTVLDRIVAVHVQISIFVKSPMR